MGMRPLRGSIPRYVLMSKAGWGKRADNQRNRGLLLLCLFGGTTSVIAQQVYAYSSIATDGQSDNVTVYATTSADYNTEYYYELSVSISAFTPTRPINDLCESGTTYNANVDAETSCNFSVSSGNCGGKFPFPQQLWNMRQRCRKLYFEGTVRNSRFSGSLVRERGITRLRTQPEQVNATDGDNSCRS